MVDLQAVSLPPGTLVWPSDDAATHGRTVLQIPEPDAVERACVDEVEEGGVRLEIAVELGLEIVLGFAVYPGGPCG